MSLSRPSLPRLSVPPPIQPKSRALAYAAVSLVFLIALAGVYKVGPRAYNWIRLNELRGRAVYDLSVDPTRALAVAREQAQRDGRHVLVVLGGNWCQWCLALDDLMRTHEDIRAHLGKHFVVVKLDSAKAKLLDDAWGKPSRLGVPVLVFLDKSGKPRHLQETVSLERWAGRILSHDPDRVLAMLRKWT